MINKGNALSKIEKIKNYLRNIKSSALRGDTSQIEEQFETFEDMIEDLENMVNSEMDEGTGRYYGGL
jgi:hypothetical protein